MEQARFIEVHPDHFPPGCQDSVILNTSEIRLISIPVEGYRTVILTTLPEPMDVLRVWENMNEIRQLLSGAVDRFDRYRAAGRTKEEMQ